MNRNFTPSPWAVYTGGAHPRIIQNNGLTVAIMLSKNTNDYDLVASAPELLQTLNNLVELHDENPSMLTAEDWSTARDIIKKVGSTK